MDLNDKYCGAKTRNGTPCRRYKLKGKKRCRLHGGLSTGPKNQKGNTNAVKNGLYSDRFDNELITDEIEIWKLDCEITQKLIGDDYNPYKKFIDRLEKRIEQLENQHNSLDKWTIYALHTIGPETDLLQITTKKEENYDFEPANKKTIKQLKSLLHDVKSTDLAKQNGNKNSV